MKNFLRKFFGQKREINYLYFSFFLLFLTVLSLSHFYTWNLPLTGVPLFFFFYAIGQALLEVCCFVLIAYILKLWTPKWIYFSFISISFILMLLHFTNFFMVRILDASIIYIFKFFFGSGIDHLIAGFQALNMNATMIGTILVAVILVPIAGILFYTFTFKIVRKKPLNVSLNQLAMMVGIIGISLFLLDLIAHPFLNKSSYSKYQKTLPLGTTFLSPAPNHLILQNPFPNFRDEETTQRLLPAISSKHLPNVYIFVIETFRRDFLNAAPHLTAFGEENISFPKSYSNASCTYLSWFSIFHADMPFYWSQMRDTWTQGSIPLQMLKKMGYKISVYSSADLRFFKMDKLIFGSERQLADKVEEFSLDWSLPPCERDALCFESMKKDLEPSGHAYIVFLDSTHSEYSFPKDFPVAYEPIATEIDYLTIGPKSPELELIKNRYRNAIHYVDDQIGRFFEHLKSKELYNDAIVAITGDHGEEFFEEGALFHGVHLNEYTTSVPLFMKFPSSEWEPQTDLATHMDIFPSILHYLTKQSNFTELFDGRSVFSLDRLPFRIAVHQNGPDIPLEFFLEKSDLKLKARFVDSSKLEILELQGYLHPDIFLPLSRNL
ncbi:MAG: sulfatase-like hydrolase/transferase [Parachlamydiales bacterium]|nr:sulfatase-like hydrolase/transferase [Parachlamydiales bacterium]